MSRARFDVAGEFVDRYLLRFVQRAVNGLPFLMLIFAHEDSLYRIKPVRPIIRDTCARVNPVFPIRLPRVPGFQA